LSVGDSADAAAAKRERTGVLPLPPAAANGAAPASAPPPPPTSGGEVVDLMGGLFTSVAASASAVPASPHESVSSVPTMGLEDLLGGGSVPAASTTLDALPAGFSVNMGLEVGQCRLTASKVQNPY